MIQVSGGEIWAEDTGGDGTPVVLVNPGWSTARIWTPLLGLLAGRFRLVRYDDRGVGRSPAPSVPFTRLADLRAVLDHTGAGPADAIASRIPGCGRIVVPGADHLLPLRAPGRLAEIITEQAGTAVLQVFQLVDHAPHLGARG